jgi:hypothetical protein
MRHARLQARSALHPGEASQAAAWVGQAVIAHDRQADAPLPPPSFDPPHAAGVAASAAIEMNDSHRQRPGARRPK